MDQFQPPMPVGADQLMVVLVKDDQGRIPVGIDILPQVIWADRLVVDACREFIHSPQLVCLWLMN
ncbi:hypothetical protein CRD60_01935 [Bifidobacterium aemilianum]|uniref:Uncharacterized protein n=1 Tax=Bifidobacterium aemilianum TaxID=2493120 RepID=A0A366KB81_9BIFI|nr:hypothetical protein CRD60_01935 [Bifidobacterium aemilianum]